jgi:diacylglycerol kinase (ATP)
MRIPRPRTRAGRYIPPVTVVLLVNPKSGRGRAVALGRRHQRALAAAGVDVKVLRVPVDVHGDPDARFDVTRFKGAEAMVVVGGDGTLTRVAATLARTSTPVYHVPVGNENLFARTFGMSRDPEALVVAVRRRDVAETDLAWMGDHPFLIMASFGPDAGVVHRLHGLRTKAIGHFAYTQPMIEELMTGKLPRVSIEIDGERIVDNRPGWTIIANARAYAVRADPARHASVFSGKLDVVFMPCSNQFKASSWFVRSRLGWHMRDRDLVYRSGRSIRVVHEEGTPAPQVDGEAVIRPNPSPTTVFRVDAAAIAVLRP